MTRPAAGLSPAEIDAHWRDEVYRGETPAQLTLKATVTGMVLGAVLALSNLYAGLKTGWAFSVAITAVVLSYASWRGLAAARLGQPIRLLENNCMMSTASAAGYTIVSVMVSAVPAYLMLTGVSIRPVWLILWSFFVASLGLMLFIPLKRQLINYDQLKFPSGLAAAQTLRGLHQEASNAVGQARVLFLGVGLGAVGYWLTVNNTIQWWRLPRIPDSAFVPGRWRGTSFEDLTIGFDFSGVSLAAGALIGLRTCLWMLAGSAASYLVLAPWLGSQGLLEGRIHFGSIQTGYSLWLGSALMVGASLTDLFFDRSTIRRALTGLRSFWPGARASSPSATTDPVADIEIPMSWFAWGATVSMVGVLIVGYVAFAIRWPMLVVSVLISFVFVLVACRSAGETDIIPVGQLGKLSQLGFGALAPGRLSTNLMATSVTTSSAACAADLATNLKAGYLLGASPRQQFVAQFLGIMVGTAVVVPAFYVLVPDPEILGTSRLAAPAAVAWRALAELLSQGLGALPAAARVALGVGLVGGIVISLLSAKWPDADWVPSAFGLGLGMVISFSQSLTFVAGAALVVLARRRYRARTEEYAVPVASGVIAGESLVGVLLGTLAALNWMPA